MKTRGGILAGLALFALLSGLACITEPEPGFEDTSSTPTEAPSNDPGNTNQVQGPECGSVEVQSQNHWIAFDSPDSLNGTEYRFGQVVPNFTLMDQYGEEVSLYQFYGMVIMVEIGATWCPYCNSSADHAEELLESYDGDCVMFLYLLIEDENGNPPDLADVQYWAEHYELNFPVLADPHATIANALGTNGIPTFFFIDREMVLRSKVEGAGSAATINRNIQILL